LARILAGVYPSDLSPTVSLAAPDALSLAGLRRLALLAGLRESDDAASTAMSLRHQGCGAPHGSLDVEIGEQGVVVRLDRTPAPDAWRRLYAVLAILSPSDDDGAHSGHVGFLTRGELVAVSTKEPEQLEHADEAR
jgi:hypothetical protein